MPRNVEIKARVRDLNDLLNRAKDVSNSPGEVLQQEDAFFKTEKGRLKLREEANKNGNEAWLIFYNRPDGDGPRMCQYQKCEVSNSKGLQSLLSDALGITGKVKKTRHLFMIGQTRVHIDTVDNLGSFMELEVGLEDDESVEKGQEIAKSLMQQLNISEEDLIPVAYADLLSAKISTLV
ncbi:hypothetical protein B566_EDAN001380 [Ephemera danica]|nr:hypothetical protein B566_EDAN001380 [Ephemera danica]